MWAKENLSEFPHYDNLLAWLFAEETRKYYFIFKTELLSRDEKEFFRKSISSKFSKLVSSKVAAASNYFSELITHTRFIK